MYSILMGNIYTCAHLNVHQLYNTPIKRGFVWFMSIPRILNWIDITETNRSDKNYRHHFDSCYILQITIRRMMQHCDNQLSYFIFRACFCRCCATISAWKIAVPSGLRRAPGGWRRATIWDVDRRELAPRTRRVAGIHGRNVRNIALWWTSK